MQYNTAGRRAVQQCTAQYTRRHSKHLSLRTFPQLPQPTPPELRNYPPTHPAEVLEPPQLPKFSPSPTPTDYEPTPAPGLSTYSAKLAPQKVPPPDARRSAAATQQLHRSLLGAEAAARPQIQSSSSTLGNEASEYLLACRHSPVTPQTLSGRTPTSQFTISYQPLPYTHYRHATEHTLPSL